MLTRLHLFVCILLSAGGCEAHRSAFTASSKNAVDSVVQPQTDIRSKTHRSQEHPSQLEENESEQKGSIENDNSA